MRSARHWLILLGLICQGLTWDDYLLPSLYGIFWFLCLKLRRGASRLGPALEGAVLVAGCFTAYLLGVALRESTHFFIGHGLALVQIVRLLRPLNQREKVFSVLVASFHLAVGCTTILDYRFILILLVALILIPKALVELAADAFAETVIPLKLRPRLGAYGAIALTMSLFFLVFPRAFIGAPFQTPGRGRGDEGTLADYVLDPSRSGSGQSGRVLFQIEGEDVGYLRCYGLINFDGLQWTGEKNPGLRRIDYVAREQLAAYKPRRVRVKNVGFLGRVLPTDGRVVYLDGKFFRRPFQNAYGIIECDAIWNAKNNIYEYWIDPKTRPERLSRAQIGRLTQHPPSSERLRRWIDERLNGVTEPLQQARRLEAFLRDHFTYNLGAPELNRLNHIDDFIFNQQQGHCERFASTLAALLRLQGIPSRIVIGYLPSTRNWFSGQYNIRFKDAHAWTEAFFDGVGWVQLDATPRATAPLTSSNFGDLVETLDFIWYSEIVNFDGPTQQQLLAASLQSLSRFPAWAHQHSALLLLVTLGPLLVFAGRKYRPRPDGKPRRSRPAAEVVAGHCYGQMLKLLAQRGVQRLPQQTPWEFARNLPPAASSLFDPVRAITEFFCLTRYGHQAVSPQQTDAVEQALDRLKQAPAASVAAGVSPAVEPEHPVRRKRVR
jgi:transglutaminase-like putative cysteine protease